SPTRAASWRLLRSRPTRRRESPSRRWFRRRARGTTRQPSSAHSEQNFHGELVELLVRVALAPHRIEVERALLEIARGVRAELHALTCHGTAIPELLEQTLNLRIGVEAVRFFFQDEIRAHAAGGEIPDALLVLRPVRVAVEVAHARPLRVLEQLDEEE